MVFTGMSSGHAQKLKKIFINLLIKLDNTCLFRSYTGVKSKRWTHGSNLAATIISLPLLSCAQICYRWRVLNIDISV